MKKLILFIVVSAGLLAFDIPKDKQMHIAAGLALYGGCEIVGATVKSEWFDHEACLAYTIAAGIGKEVYDVYTPGHTPEMMDAAATVAIPIFSYTIIVW